VFEKSIMDLPLGKKEYSYTDHFYKIVLVFKEIKWSFTLPFCLTFDDIQ